MTLDARQRYREAHPDRVRESSRKYRRAHPQPARQPFDIAALTREQLDAFWQRISAEGEDACWPWTGKLHLGYGWFRANGGQIGAHRLAYLLTIGPIAEGLELDHLCRNRSCCNPTHLEPVTREENKRRGESSAAQRARQTHCQRGHEFTPENTRLIHDGKHRECWTCRREWARAYKRRRRAAGCKTP